MTSSDIESLFEQFENEIDFASDEFLSRFTHKLSDYFDKQYSTKSVLGLDIYKYSKMEMIGQTVIPYVFSVMYNETVKSCITRETLFFGSKDINWFKNNYIDTGDGCFQIFDNPIQALIFAIHFQAMIRVFNTGNFKPLLSMAINSPITIRYTITTDSIMTYQSNIYGPAIINNARIISCDSLNRLLIDNSTYEWFMLNINGIETLQALIVDDFIKMDDVLFSKSGNSVIIKQNDKDFGIIRTDVQQIENIDVKNSAFRIYSLHMQIALKRSSEIGLRKTIVSIGNLNTSGLRREI